MRRMFKQVASLQCRGAATAARRVPGVLVAELGACAVLLWSATHTRTDAQICGAGQHSCGHALHGREQIC
jgi:hypothetical protein